MQVANHAATHNDSYQWIVRTRPDLFFVGALASTLKLPRQDAIYARGRRFGPRWDAIRGTKRNNKPNFRWRFQLKINVKLLADCAQQRREQAQMQRKPRNSLLGAWLGRVVAGDEASHWDYLDVCGASSHGHSCQRAIRYAPFSRPFSRQ